VPSAVHCGYCKLIVIHPFGSEKADSAAFSISDSDLYMILRCLFVDAIRYGLAELSGSGLDSFAVVLAH
jgi:hypothetical protein